MAGNKKTGAEAGGGDAALSPAKPVLKTRKVVVGVIAAIVVAIAAWAIYSVFNGDLAPTDAAAKYAGFNYVREDEVSDYIAMYREQMGVADSSDEDWATFLAAYNLSPARLRYTTIQQLITDDLVRKKAAELGLEASEEEVDATISTLRDTVALGDDEILRETMEAHGQTMEGLREVYRQAILKRLVLSAEVEQPQPSEEQVKAYITKAVAGLATAEVHHTYCFRVTGREADAKGELYNQVKKLRDEFANGEKTAEGFADIVAEYSDDEDLKASQGANGWDLDTSGYDQEYLEELAGMKEGDVSPVLGYGDVYEFIWLNITYDLPADSDKVDDLDPNTMPESLWQYFSDSAAYQLWEKAGDEYLDQLLEDANVVYYPMPSNVPYNVDMTLADVQLEEVSSDESL